MKGICCKPHQIAAAAVLRFIKVNVCDSVVGEDISFTPRKADISVRITARYGVELNETELKLRLSRDMPKYGGADIFAGIYAEAGYVNFIVSDAFMLGCAEKLNSCLPPVSIPGVIELPESPEYAAAKLMNFARVCDKYFPSALNRRALWQCMGLAGDADKTRLRRRLRTAVSAVLNACDAGNAVLGGKAASAAAKLILYAAYKVN